MTGLGHLTVRKPPGDEFLTVATRGPTIEPETADVMHVTCR